MRISTQASRYSFPDGARFNSGVSHSDGFKSLYFDRNDSVLLSSLRSIGVVAPVPSIANEGEVNFLRTTVLGTSITSPEKSADAIPLQKREESIKQGYQQDTAPTDRFSTNEARAFLGEFQKLSVTDQLANRLENEWADYIDNTETLKRSENIYALIKEDASNADWDVEWNFADGEYDRAGCGHLDFSESGIKRRSVDHGISLPREITGALRFITNGAPVWILNYTCGFGGTMSGLGAYSTLLVVDFSIPQPRSVAELIVKTSTYLGASYESQQSLDTGSPSARLSQSFLAIWSSTSDDLLVYDVKTKQIVIELSDLPNGDLLIDAAFTEDMKHVVQMNSDGSFFVHRIEDGATVLSGRVVDGEVAVWTDDFRFDATAEAAAQVDLRFPGLDGQFSFDRFDAALRAEGLVAQVLAGNPPPPVEINVPPDLKGQVTGDGTSVTGNFTLDPSRRASELRLYQDGVLTDTVAIDPDAASASLEADRLPGTRWATVVAADAEGLVSLPVSADLGVPTSSGRRKMLAVGVDLYDDQSLLDLNYAKNDGMKTTEAAMDIGFADVDVLIDDTATPAAILAAVDDTLDDLGPGDQAVLFFAGHALQDKAGNLYLGTTGTDPSRLAETALPWAAVAERLTRTKGRVTILLDACHSGAAGTVAFATNDDAARGLTAVPSNVTIVAASKGRQTSLESNAAGGGYFSNALAEIIAGDRAAYDTNGNGAIEASELQRGLRTLIDAQSNGAQTPWMTKSRMVGDYALF